VEKKVVRECEIREGEFTNEKASGDRRMGI